MGLSCCTLCTKNRCGRFRISSLAALPLPGRYPRDVRGGPGGFEAAGVGQEEEQGRDGPQALSHQEPPLGVCQLPR